MTLLNRIANFPTSLVRVLEPTLHVDGRGHFFESFSQGRLLAETGFNFSVAQVNNSLSKRGTLRGVHFKEQPPGQAKFISVTWGSILDVAIDLRASSPTFGCWDAFELSADNRRSLFLGYGVGHAFLALEENTQVTYLCDSAFEPSKEHGINPLKAGIDWRELSKPWGLFDFVISEKDLAAPDLKDAQHLLFS